MQDMVLCPLIEGRSEACPLQANTPLPKDFSPAHPNISLTISLYSNLKIWRLPYREHVSSGCDSPLKSPLLPDNPNSGSPRYGGLVV